MLAMLSDQPDDVLCCHSLFGFQPLLHRGMQSWKTYIAYHVMHVAQHDTGQHSAVQYQTVQYSTVQYSTVQYSTVQYNTGKMNIVI